MKAPVYLDYNATTPIAKEVVKEMMPYLRTNFGNPSSGYESGRLSKEAIEQARLQVANLIGASPEEIIFTSEISQVLKAMNVEPKVAAGTVRLSVGKIYN